MGLQIIYRIDCDECAMDAHSVLARGGKHAGSEDEAVAEAKSAGFAKRKSGEWHCRSCRERMDRDRRAAAKSAKGAAGAA